MRLEGELTRPSIKKYYATGTLEQKMVNKPLQQMLKKIQDGGMNEFLNDKELGQFAGGLQENFQKEGYLNKDDTLTPSGEDVVTSGKAWRGLQGAFSFTVLEYQGKAYLLDAVLVEEYNRDINPHDRCPYKFNEVYSAVDEKEFRNVQLDQNWAEYKQDVQSPSVKFVYEYDTDECMVRACWKDSGKDYKISFTTTDKSDFVIIKENDAQELLKEREESEGVFEFSYQYNKSIQIVVQDSSELDEKNWIKDFFKKGCFDFDNILLDRNEGIATIKDICLYIEQEDTNSMLVLLQEFLLDKARTSYLGYEEVGRLVNEFQELFTSPYEKCPSCPPIMEDTKSIYNMLVERAKEAYEKNDSVPYLHLQAYIDLSPEDTKKPYMELTAPVNLTNKELSFEKLVQEVFGCERTIESVCLLSKYTSSNGRNARAITLFAKSIAQCFGASTRLVTTKSEMRPSNNQEYRGSDQKWYKKMKECVHLKVVEKKLEEIKDIHDRYFMISRTDGSVEWWTLTGELDSLRFNNDTPRIRKDITITTEGRVKEMTFAKIKKGGVPELARKLMEEE